MRRFVQTARAGLLIWPLLLTACGDDRDLAWTEDVLLPDGRTVTLTRHQELKGPHELFQPATPSDYWFEFTNPDTGQTVRWESDQDLATRSLAINDKVPELLIAPVSSGIFKYQCPDPPYLAFQFVDGKWTAVPLTRIAHKRVSQNMTYLFADTEPALTEHRYHLTAADIEHTLPAEYRGKVIDLTSLSDQRFGTHCFPPFNWMLRDARNN
jgi:hypothetical protein